jgi:hypothetical protein
MVFVRIGQLGGRQGIVCRMRGIDSRNLRIGFDPMRGWLPLLAARVLANEAQGTLAKQALRLFSGPSAVAACGSSHYIACV